MYTKPLPFNNKGRGFLIITNQQMIFKHKPKLGDVIYSLPLIKHLGGGTLYLDPVSPYFKNREKEWIDKFNWLIPLLAIQPYIHKVEIYQGQKYDMDLDKIHTTSHLTKGNKVSIVENNFIAQNVDFQLWDGLPWLRSHYTDLRTTSSLFANSKFYHNDTVDWCYLLETGSGFTGTFSEFVGFKKRVGKTQIGFLETNTALDLLALINGCNTFYGNQSLPLAIALGLGKKCFVEESPIYPNCIVGDYTKL